MRHKGKLWKKIAAFFLVGALSLQPVMSVKAVGPETAIATGIDVSKYQGAIDWAAVAASGVKFAFIKVGSMKSGIDPYFANNMIGAASNGIRTGVYIYSYATTVEEVAYEAAFVLNAISNYQVSFPVVYDVEDTVHRNMTPDQLAELANTFCSIVYAEGYTPMVYASTSWFTSKIGATPFDKWVAQYNTACAYPNPAIWQASSSASVPGIAGRVDFNYLYKDYFSQIIPFGFQVRDGFTYFYDNYKLQKGWVTANGLRYYMHPVTGAMHVGWLTTDPAGTYFMAADGHMSVGFTPIGDKMYYFNEMGHMQTGFIQLPTGFYMFDPTGVMQTGWINDGAGLRYFAEDGHMLAGLSPIGSDVYYLADNGYMQTGWVTIGDGRYYFDLTSGKMQTGWISDGVNKYYLGADGRMATGAQTIDGQVYVFAADTGAMQTGWVTIEGNQYFFDANGIMQTGWVSNGVISYYFGADGKLATGVQTIDGKIYCFGDDGVMQTGLITIDDRTFFFGTDGTLYKGWFNDGVHVYYFGEDGSMTKNTTMTMDGVTYSFDANGYATK